MDLKQTIFVDKKYVNRFTPECVVCKNKNSKRIMFVIINDEGTIEKKAVCFSYPLDKRSYEEIVEHQKIHNNKGVLKPYNEMFPICWETIFGKTKSPRAAGLVLKRDAGLKCIYCGTTKFRNKGVWISPSKLRTDEENKTVVCWDCLKQFLK